MSEFESLFQEYDKQQPLSENPDDFGDVFDRFENLKAQQLKTSINTGIKKNPDQYSNITKLARKHNLPPETVESQQESIEQKDKFQGFDFEKIQKESPVLARFLRNRMNAGIAHDDIENLSDLEKAFQTTTDVARSLPSGAVDFFGRAISGLGVASQAAARTLTRGMDAVLPESMDKFLYYDENAPEWTKKLDPGYWLRYEGGGLKEAAKIIGAPEERKTIATDIGAGVGQVAGQLSLLFVAPWSGTGALFSQGVDIQSEKQEKAGKAGTVQGDIALAEGGMVTLITERMGLDALMNRLPPKIKGRLLRYLADLSIAGGIEAVQEVVEGIGQNLIEYARYNPDAEIFEGLEREAIVAGGTGVIVRAIINALTPGRGRSTDDQKRIDDMINAAKESKLRSRDSESFKELVKQVRETYGQNENIYIPAEELAKIVDDLPDSSTKEEIRKQLPEASLQNSDVVLTVEDYLTDIAPEDETLRPHVRLSADALSQSEIKELGETNAQAAKSLMEEAKKNVELKTQADEVMETVTQQLIDTGRLNPQNARLSAKIMSAYVSTKAARENRTVEDVFNDIGVQIVGPDVEVEQEKFLAQQDFGDIKFTDEFQVEGTKEKVKVSQSAQKLWDTTIKRRDMIKKLADCL